MMLTWWNARTSREQLFAYTVLIVFLTFLALEAIEVTNVLLILPFPLFVSIFFKRELPHFIVRYLARQGIDTIIFKGGWTLFSSRLRHRMKVWSNRRARNIIGIRRYFARHIITLQPT